MSVARLNFSHGTKEDVERRSDAVREAAGREGRPVAILADLQGPKVRLGTFSGGKALLRRGKTFVLTTRKVAGTEEGASVDHGGLPCEVRKGDAILLNDGLVRLKVLSTDDRDVRCRVEEGGEVSDRKGVNIPTRETTLPSLTPKDRADLSFALSLGVDCVALSFVRSAKDVEGLKRILRGYGESLPVIAKLEKAQALENLGSILRAADGVMVARGDLGVEVGVENVPALQKRIIREANLAGVSVITATQMLETMIRNPVPTRAEVSDVANAVEDGSDAVMLSAETAAGAFPEAAVETMRRVVEKAEAYVSRPPVELGLAYGVEGVVADAACRAAATLGARAIAVFSRSGLTARILSKFHPPAPVVAFTPHEATARRMALYRGVSPRLLSPVAGTKGDEDDVERAVAKIRSDRIAPKGSPLVVVYGSVSGHCDQMRVVTL
jgi:pyruvate kinase